jgi:RHS repeat-associated protein
LGSLLNPYTFHTIYDSVGNTSQDANGQTFVYDAENKQVQVSNASGIVGQYYYDGDGKRIKKFVPSTSETTIFVYDAGGKMVAEYSTVTASQSEAKISYLTNDHLGSPRITTDAIGKVIARHDLLPFGEEIQRANYGSDNLRNRFTSYQRDMETNLDFAQARMFGSGLGRFTSPDPLAASAKPICPQSWNRYTYSYNNPLRFTDPSGMVPADYYAEDGTFLGTDGNEKDKNNYVVKGKGKENKNTKLTPDVAIATLPTLEERKAIADTGSRSQKSTNYYKGKESSKNDPYGNFHEEAVVIGTDSAGKTQIINTAPGVVYSQADSNATAPTNVAANQSQQTQLDTMISDGKVSIIAHSHPEGGVFPPPKPGSIMMSGTAIDYGQPPSNVDIGGANRAKTFIAVSTRENKVYFYGKNGLQATFPLDKFRKVGK